VNEVDKLQLMIGRKQIQLEELDQQYSRLTNVLAGVVSGAIAPSRVMVNLTDRTWTVAAPDTRPGMPATVNGLPICVVAPEPATSGPLTAAESDS